MPAGSSTTVVTVRWVNRYDGRSKIVFRPALETTPEGRAPRATRPEQRRIRVRNFYDFEMECHRQGGEIPHPPTMRTSASRLRCSAAYPGPIILDNGQRVRYKNSLTKRTEAMASGEEIRLSDLLC
jgi:hypothetical protein